MAKAGDSARQQARDEIVRRAINDVRKRQLRRGDQPCCDYQQASSEQLRSKTGDELVAIVLAG